LFRSRSHAAACRGPPAEACRTERPSRPCSAERNHPTMTDTFKAPEGWTDLDKRAVDTARVLAADAVEKVGSGHPGTAVSLAPAAYLLYQDVMRHDPRDKDWLCSDRFVI